jgi:putative transposase
VIVVDAGSGLPIGRPWVTVLLDRASRAITGFRVSFEPPSAASLLDCLRIGVGLKDALLATVSGIRGAWRCCGAPKTLICDQGVEFKSKAFLEACLSLMIDVEYTPAFKAWYKGRIERFFRTLARDVFHRVPGSTFANFFERNKEEIPERVAVVTLDELRAFTLLYIVDVYNNRPHRALAGRSPQDLYDEMAGQQGMRLPPPADELAALTSPVAYRTVQRYGIEFEGLIYQAPVLASFRTQQERPDKVRIRVDRRDLTRIWFVDPRDGEDKPIPISPAMRPLVEGISLEKHRLARAMQLANPQRLAGEAGLKRAYRILDAAMAERSTQDGLQNRTKAARYWEILNRPPRPEEPAEFDVDRSSHSIVEAAITDAYPEDIGTADASSAEANPPDTAQGTMPQPDASPTADQTTSKPAPKRKRATPSRQVPPKDDAAETGQEEDVDELARRLNLRVSKQEGE